MRRIIHLSDVHFGRTDPPVVAAVLALVPRLEPHLVAISGDLTQRARAWQFREARAFLDALPCPQLVVPGNHDVPLYNVARRFLDPLGNYRRYITTNLRPVHTDQEFVAVGLNTTRSFTVKDGTIRPPDLRHAREALVGAGDEAVKVIVAHHPFEYPQDSSTRWQKAAVIRALESLAGAGADVFLTGHLHLSYTGHTAGRYRIAGRTAVIVEAGTATSTRQRGETNSFNLLHIERSQIVVERWQWQQGSSGFIIADAQTFDRSASGWSTRTPEPPPVDVRDALRESSNTPGTDPSG
jgi:3',5'-cyclic AMP phosphodiesterase CpdA